MVLLLMKSIIMIILLSTMNDVLIRLIGHSYVDNYMEL